MLTHTATARVPVAADEIDVGEWFFGLSDRDYAATARHHLGAGTSGDGGRRRFFDAEGFPGVVIVNHHVEEEARRDYVRVRSRDSSARLLGVLPVPLDVSVEIGVRPVGDAEAELECRLHLGLPRGLEWLARVLGAKGRQRRHNAEQTRGFADDIEAKAYRARTIRLSAGDIRVRERGEGDPIVFIHGVFMNGDTWREVVPRLAGRHRCIVPDWPTGGHRIALSPDARPSPPLLAELVVELLDALEVERATLVGIGLGTVLCEMVAIEHPERVDRVVFGSGDILSTFPPRWARLRFASAFLPPTALLAALLFRIPAVRRNTYRMFAHEVDDRIAESFTRGVRTDAGVRRDAMRLLRAIFVGRTGVQHERLRAFDRPALVAWGADDIAFPESHPDDLAALLRDVRVERIAGARTFLGQDQPEAFADSIARFAEA
ncbi:MAG TPA: alpha/beta hydrolase [Solirubrobacteraceae bacterium]|nr:alpha/beta hydrolase [Solirubrobacteraceae bacterium]